MVADLPPPDADGIVRFKHSDGSKARFFGVVLLALVLLGVIMTIIYAGRSAACG